MVDFSDPFPSTKIGTSLLHNVEREPKTAWVSQNLFLMKYGSIISLKYILQLPTVS